MQKFLDVINTLLPLAERHRAYLYRVFVVIATALAAAGYIDGSKLGVIVGIVSTVLAVPPGLAAANTSTKRQDGAVSLDLIVGVLVGIVGTLVVQWAVRH